MEISFNLATNTPWLILSNTLLMSKKKTDVKYFLSMALKISSVVCITDVPVECHFLPHFVPMINYNLMTNMTKIDHGHTLTNF